MFSLGLIMGMLHLATAQTVEVNICHIPSTPVISAPLTGVDTVAQGIEVDGTADASTVVDILDNGQEAGSVSSDGSGNFGATIQLSSGSNSIVAEVANNCGQAIDSSAVLATYTPPPPPPPPKKAPAPVTPPPAVVSITESTSPAVILNQIAAPTASLPGKGLKLNLVSSNDAASAQAAVSQSTSASSVVVSGSTGVAANVAVIVNGKVVADVLSDSSGHFSIRVPLSYGKNKVQFTATLGDKTITKTLKYTRTAAVTGLGLGMVTTSLISGAGAIVLLGLIIVRFYRRRKRREDKERNERFSHAPQSI
jgi:hypothetical protein